MKFKPPMQSPFARLTKCLTSIALLTIPLGGCGMEIFKTRCPTLAQYSKDFQSQAAGELPKAGVAVQTLVTDYGKFRDACRAMDR